MWYYIIIDSLAGGPSKYLILSILCSAQVTSDIRHHKYMMQICTCYCVENRDSLDGKNKILRIGALF